MEPDQQKAASSSHLVFMFPPQLWEKIVLNLEKKKFAGWKEADIPALFEADMIY
jgi:hypothetical protein